MIMKQPNRLLLNMIVKNEAANLPRCLEAIEPHIVGAAIVDTGSSDDTVGLITAFFRSKGKPVQIGHEPFIDFSQARNAGLRLARSVDAVDWEYILLCDADMELVVENPWPKLTASSYALMQDNKVVRYYNVRLLRRDNPVEYVGVTHECLQPVESPVAIQGGIWYRDHETGANRVEKYVRDIRLLTSALRDDPLNPRNVFYMIQSLIGTNQIATARQMLDFRLQLDGHPEEQFWCMMQRAHLDKQLGAEPGTVALEFLQAYQYRTNRAEPLYHLAVFHRDREEYDVALIYAMVAASMPMPDEILPVETSIYDWMALDELLAIAIRCRDLIQSQWAARELHSRWGKVPEEQRARIKEHIAQVLPKPNRKKGKR